MSTYPTSKRPSSPAFTATCFHRIHRRIADHLKLEHSECKLKQIHEDEWQVVGVPSAKIVKRGNRFNFYV